jgi:hypothetical protein
MIPRFLVEFDLDVVTAELNNPSAVPVFSALDASSLCVLGWARACPTT